MVAHLGHASTIYIYILHIFSFVSTSRNISTCGNKVKDFILLGKTTKDIFLFAETKPKIFNIALIYLIVNHLRKKKTQEKYNSFENIFFALDLVHYKKLEILKSN